MKHAWFSTQELLSVAGLPGTRQGLCDLARREKWNRSRRQGAQGRGMEYAFDSLPAAVQQALLRREMRDGDEAEWALDAPGAGVSTSLSTWIAIYRQLTIEERERVIAFVMREGIGAFIVRLGLQRE
ncbi:putative DNA-binding transcriptional regulator [Candidatus Sodalis endolongispinus]|uniref:DNA-binding transcriptional regulator n=1 Tax=Candidatus Sodalis endolongispinus TaxID=2812662 RepID=A0ABS5YBU6_9GAMM|nr:DNA-binding protein [Candidatus Sodalis endolongispinus]MBT9432481.1 putative DNA-binding transcriptional regulator [Candidatus Sodalis endolongispinus]